MINAQKYNFCFSKLLKFTLNDAAY